MEDNCEDGNNLAVKECPPVLPDHSSKLTQPLTTEMFYTADGMVTVDNKSHRADKKIFSVCASKISCVHILSKDQ